jgi:hypothetical protein
VLLLITAKNTFYHGDGYKILNNRRGGHYSLLAWIWFG